MNIRIIPRLDIKGPNLVKGIHFEGLRVLGKPEQFARFYYENGADELFYQDTVASLYGRNSLLDIIRKTSRETFIPLCVGGGLRSAEDIRKVLRAGADKVAINTEAILNPGIIKEAVQSFGSSTIIVSIEAIKKKDNSYEACINYGRDLTGLDAVEWAKKAVDLGAGELFVTAIDKEGTGEGFDIDLTRRIAGGVSVPVVACGGCGSVENIFEVINKGMADAVSIASILHYYLVENGKLALEDESFVDEGNTTFLNEGRGFGKIDASTIQEIKNSLFTKGVSCRIENYNP